MAQYQLGVCLENGFGVAKDEREAMEWYEKAAEQGHEEAKEKVASPPALPSREGAKKEGREKSEE